MGLVHALHARGERTKDLPMHLFEAYKKVEDENFNRFIFHLEFLYENGDDINAEELMVKAATQHASLIEKGIWKAPTAKDKKIMALETRITNMAKDLKSAKKQGKQNGKGNNRINDVTLGRKLVRKKEKQRPRRCTRSSTIGVLIIRCGRCINLSNVAV